MELVKFAAIALCLFLSVNSFGQTQTTKDEETNKVWLFTDKERDSMQIWFYNRATAMGLSDDIREEYYNIILYHSFKMARLDDKDRDFTPTEIRTRFDTLLAKQHSEVKAILNEEQFGLYLKKYDLLLKSVFERNGWDKN
ncbi:hypothetical protein [Spongiimicrobium sp. 3-5]|uniref:hypothetical protein n=1 Tax=Spongiimicrobium sp. 3-5 TaxID=3332596 RepID=UPI00397FD1CE